jgi:hypothetical protein
LWTRFFGNKRLLFLNARSAGWKNYGDFSAGIAAIVYRPPTDRLAGLELRIILSDDTDITCSFYRWRLLAHNHRLSRRQENNDFFVDILETGCFGPLLRRVVMWLNILIH